MTGRLASRSHDVARFRAEVDEWARRLKVNPSAVHLRPMTKKWASCSSGGLVSFSTRLLVEDGTFRESVIVHELLHLKIPNHGKLFKSLIRAYLPNVPENPTFVEG
ncbi:MAG: M48 metallopeptidase family protein [Thermoplasmata archaeon]